MTITMERIGKFRETLEWLRDHPELADGFEFDRYLLRVSGETLYKDFKRKKPAMGPLGWYIYRNPDCGLVMKPCEFGLKSMHVLVYTTTNEWLTSLSQWPSYEQLEDHTIGDEYVMDHFGITAKDIFNLFTLIGCENSIVNEVSSCDVREYAERSLMVLDKIMARERFLASA